MPYKEISVKQNEGRMKSQYDNLQFWTKLKSKCGKGGKMVIHTAVNVFLQLQGY